MKIYDNLTVIAAVALVSPRAPFTDSLVIGDRLTNKLPWSKPIPGDLPWFKSWTRGVRRPGDP